MPTEGRVIGELQELSRDRSWFLCERHREVALRAISSIRSLVYTKEWLESGNLNNSALLRKYTKACEDKHRKLRLLADAYRKLRDERDALRKANKRLEAERTEIAFQRNKLACEAAKLGNALTEMLKVGESVKELL